MKLYVFGLALLIVAATAQYSAQEVETVAGYDVLDQYNACKGYFAKLYKYAESLPEMKIFVDEIVQENSLNHSGERFCTVASQELAFEVSSVSNLVETPVIGITDLESSIYKAFGSDAKAHKTVIFIIPDYNKDYDDGLYTELKDSILKLASKLGANTVVVRLNWKKYSQGVYLGSLNCAQPVGVAVTMAFDHLNHDVEVGKVVIGHGIGAHLAGFMGKHMRIHHILALDPTSWCIDHDVEGSHLTKTDAMIVEVYHTNFLMGYIHALGYLDSYSSNLDSAQNGCRNVLDIQCNHDKAVRTTTQSIKEYLTEGKKSATVAYCDLSGPTSCYYRSNNVLLTYPYFLPRVMTHPVFFDDPNILPKYPGQYWTQRYPAKDSVFAS